MNLENLGVQEMNANELVNVDGGNIFHDIGNAVGTVVGGAVAVVVVAAHIAVDSVIDH